MAAGIVFHLPVLYRLAAFEVVRLQKGAARGVDLNLQRDPQLAAVAEHRFVHRGQPCWAYILVETFPEGTFLGKAGGELDLGSIADCPVSTANAFPGFEQGAGVTQLAQFIRRGEPSDAATQDDDAGTFAGARRLLDCSRGRGGNGQQAQGLHHGEGGAVSASLTHPHQKIAPAQTHF